MDQRGARYLARERQAAEVAAEPAVSECHEAAPGPVWQRAQMDAGTFAVLAGMFDCSVKDFESRYAPKKKDCA